MKTLNVGSLLLFLALIVGPAAAHNGEYKPPPGRTMPPPGGKPPITPGTDTPRTGKPRTPTFDGPETTPDPRAVGREEALPWEFVWELLRDGEPEPPPPLPREAAKGVTEALVLAARDENLEVRLHAVLALARGGDGPPAITLLAADGELMRSVAVIAAGFVDPDLDSVTKRARSVLAHVMADPEAPELVRGAAALSTGRTGSGAANRLLATLGEKPLDLLRRGCLIGLGQSGHPGAREVLLPAVLPPAADPASRIPMVYALSRLTSVGVERDLIARLRDPDQGVRAAAAMSLSSRVISFPAVRAALIDLAKAGRVRARSAALLTLTLAGDAMAPDLAKAGLRDALARGSGLPELAALCLGLLRAAESGQDLVKLASDEAGEPGLRAAAALAAGLVRARGGAKDLASIVARERDPFVAGYAAIGLALLAPDAAVAPILSRLRTEKRFRARRLLVQALGRTTGEKTVAALVTALGDDYEVNREAIRSLFRADPPRAAAEALLRLGDEKNAFARRFGVLALSRARERRWPTFYARVLLGTALDTRDPLVALLLYLESDLLHGRWGKR